MVRLKERARKRKRGWKGRVYLTEPQSRPQLRVRKHTPRDPKITWYENNQIRVGKYDKSAYGVIIMYFPLALPFANKLIHAVSVARRWQIKKIGVTKNVKNAKTVCAVGKHRKKRPEVCRKRNRQISLALVQILFSQILGSRLSKISGLPRPVVRPPVGDRKPRKLEVWEL